LLGEEMTREELKQIVDENQKIVDEAEAKIRSANQELAKFKASDKQEANTQLSIIHEEMRLLWNRAEELVNEFELEFSFESDYGDYLEMDIYREGMWAYSTC
jgi:hypothetical protein